MPTDLKSFDLPSKSEMRFSVNPDSIIEYALINPGTEIPFNVTSY